MHINVTDILAQDLGFSRSYGITDERPDLDEVKLTESINGELTLTKLDRSIAAEGQVTAEIELECHRCLRTFNRPVRVRFSRHYAEQPQDDELPISQRATIDVGELIQQEILVNLPIKLLCRDDCPGIEVGGSQATTGAPD